ncbi:uncharacterized protein TRAVEDRAFT_153349 [Trametes versicolor FP-101664 SS1]|uniref:uncharacterized protein n=1 Tax=Trametes versicolor (strain FP-101664) TaxID=717944 RepID=UPI00046249D5|nr:uncharacterized protein TRAVEDRAFT_153349 [Trametes versicolor FP-101664 SS1]EIW55037.1 hypothetical protein TRAVEDRAFT_153349 [Trametes versicolor FP-101664 SS1]
MLRVDPNVLDEKPPPVEPEYPHTSVFRSSQAEVHVRSPSVKVLRGKGYDSAQSLPVFGDHDKVTGSVLLDVSLCATPGRLTISLQGTFVYMSPNAGQSDSESYVALSRPERHRHVFFSASETRPTGDLDSPRSSTSLRDAFAASVRYRRERRPSQTSIKGALRPFPFSFAIPRPEQSGQELPPTFSSVAVGECGPRGRTCVERAEVSYAVIATWEAADGVDRAFVEAPVLYQPDADFQSFDGLAMQKDSWLEIPLKSDRPLPVACAVTLPHPVTFSRSGSIPYFVVFTTNPRSATLAREIATDATISVSLQREVRVDAATPLYATPSPTGTPSTSSDESESLPPVSSRRLLKRVVTARSAPASLARARQPPKEKPLPQLPSPGVNETRALHVDMCIGFPKRPRYRCEPHQKHPPLESHASLPDGLYKGKIQLDKHMLPAFDWAGLRVKYYLDVSVIFGQDQMRARVPLRIS